MYQEVRSKLFANQMRLFPSSLREDVEKTIARVLVNPTLLQYKRPYLTPYMQDHPTDKTITIFFEVIGPDRVFFVWVNDAKHPHDTHKNHGEDPCLKQFKFLRDSGSLETYDPHFHEGKLTVQPRAHQPSFLQFKKYDVEIFASTYTDGQVLYTMALATYAHPQDIHDHYAVFLEKIREHFASIKKAFEIRVNTGDKDFEQLLDTNIDKTKWKYHNSSGDIWWSI